MDIRSDRFRIPPTRWTLVAYCLMVLATVAAFMLIRSHGETLVAPSVPGDQSFAGTTTRASDALLHVLVALAAVIIAGQAFARLFAYAGQPPVIGEVVAGIFLGPSLLGSKLSALILPPAVAPFLGVIAHLGVILYMFLIGLDLNLGRLRQRSHATVATSHASILAPFLLGAVASLGLYPRLSNSNVPFTSFALFMAVAMSITAFPVLARILTDRDMARTELGVIALSCAAIDDVTAWCLLAFVVGVAKAEVGEGFLVAAGALAYITFMFLVARPALRRLMQRRKEEQLSRATVALVLFALFLSALATEAIGIHAIFGAFLFGAIIPRDSAVVRFFPHHLEHLVAAVLLPAFFAFTGMRTRIDLVSGWDQWLMCGVIILLATLGKFGGTLAAAYLTGLSWRDAAILGTLMNTRGLMELVVLNVGLDLGIISPTLFAMMVLMALVTTVVTSPVLGLLKPPTAAADGSG